MEAPRCQGCRDRDALIADLQQHVQALATRVRELEDRLGQNSTNSSVPPSANPVDAPKPVVKPPSGRRTGAQPGHEPHLRLRLPPERLQRVVPFIPTHCRACQTPLPATASPDDPAPSWHQVAELPAIRAEVTEYQGQARTCPDCGAVTRAAIPAEVCVHSLGPQLAATLVYLRGRHHLSQRGLTELAETLFDVPLAVGSVSHLQEQMSAALAPAHAEVAAAVQAAAVKNVDETGWKLAGRLCWLWVAVTQHAALFVVHARRGAQGLRTLLGATLTGVIGSDRWSAYQTLDLEQRQVCWAHLRRDFQGMVDRGGAGAAVGDQLLFYTELLFLWWHKVRDGTRRRAWFLRQVESIRSDVVLLLERGRVCGCAKTAGMCREILAVEPALWTFARVAGVEPTNNAAERVLRPAVLWRKRSFGCASETGCRFVERVLTAVQTLRLQQRNVLAYLTEALVAHRANLPAPKLLSAG